MSRRDPWSLVNALVLSAVAIAARGGLGADGPWRMDLLHDPAARPRIRPAAPRAEAVRQRGAPARGRRPCSCWSCRLPTRSASAGRRSRAGSMRGWLEVHIFCGIVGPVARHVSHVVQVQRDHLGGVLVDGRGDGLGVRRALPVRAHPEVHPRRRADARRDPGADRTAHAGARRLVAADRACSSGCRKSSGNSNRWRSVPCSGRPPSGCACGGAS